MTHIHIFPIDPSQLVTDSQIVCNLIVFKFYMADSSKELVLEIITDNYFILQRISFQIAIFFVTLNVTEISSTTVVRISRYNLSFLKP